MPYEYKKMGRLPMDTRMVKEISRSAAMSSEQGDSWLGDWGGPSRYRIFAHLPYKERITYAAILDGSVDPSEIEVATGLTLGEINAALVSLNRGGLVKLEKATGKVSTPGTSK